MYPDMHRRRTYMIRLMTKRIAFLLVLLWATALSAADTQQRPANWAQPVEAAELQNFYRLDDKVYRSAQPDRKGFEAAYTLGIRNVLNLRNYHSDDSKAKGVGLKLFRVKMEAGEFGTDTVVKALRIIKESEGPILIHCWHGSDRTGAVSALYRIVFQGWSKEDAVAELKNGGYGYHSIYSNIPQFIRDADIDGIKKRVFAP
jgi:protein tyrosine/serine phosphatase